MLPCSAAELPASGRSGSLRGPPGRNPPEAALKGGKLSPLGRRPYSTENTASRMISLTVGCGKMTFLISDSRIFFSIMMTAEMMISLE